MKHSQHMHGWYRYIKGYHLVVVLLALLSAWFLLFTPSPTASALTTVPTKMNFQGRLTDASGNIKPNGTYNMRLKLYTVSTAGSAVWSEDRLVSATQGVQVTNGLFSIQLGDITSLPASLFASGPLYLEVELPTPATATSASPTWTEGPMTPRNQMATSAYAYNAETIDGIDSANLAQLDANNTFSGNAVFTGSLQGAGLDTSSASALSLGSTNATAINLNQSTTVLAGKTLTVGTSSNGIILSDTGITLAGTARGTKQVALTPEYLGATFRGDGTNNNGSLSSDFCSASDMMNINTTVCNTGGEEHNFYEWTTAQATAQDYDLYIKYRVPKDFDTGSMTSLVFLAQGTTATESAVMSIYQNGTQCFTTGDVVTVGGDWEGLNTTNPTFGTCSIQADSQLVIKVSLSATQNQYVRVGDITFSYRSKF